MNKINRFRGISSLSALTIGLSLGTGASAQSAPAQAGAEATAPVDDIIVTANKRAVGQSVHDTAIAVTALGATQLREGNIQSISDLTVAIPNVNLNSQNTGPGVNNFSIRGMGIYSTIPSSTPTVGVFIDGVYVGANAGVALASTFDIDGIEVLRGPQGLLFGRNVTAGAILVTTGIPTDRLHINAQAGIESGPNMTFSTVVSGPITSNGVLSGKIALSYNDDKGYFHNLFNGNKHFGARTSTIARGALRLKPESNAFTSTVRFEVGSSEGDGVVTQNQADPTLHGTDVRQNEEGFNDTSYQNVTWDTRIPTSFGNGEIVNIFGWRHVDGDTLGDADSRPVTAAHLGIFIRQKQWSNELRYAGTFGPVSATIGGFYYGDKLNYVETRDLAAARLEGGGIQKSWTYALFSNFDIKLPANFTLNLGARYSKEHKSASTQALSAALPLRCNLNDYTCPTSNFSDDHSWNAFTPKIGLEWNPTSETHFYGYYTKGFRSGGYNLRQVTLTSPPGPYDQEVENSFEVGWKQKMFDNRLRFSVAAFQNKYKNLQRDLAILDPVLGNIQTTRNTADVTIRGVEFEGSFQVNSNLQLGGNFGYLHSRFDLIRIGFTNGGAVTPSQYDLKLPYLAPWSYGVWARYSTQTGIGQATGRVSFQHIDAAFSNDINVNILNPTNTLDANLSLGIADTNLTVAVYGKNLLNKTYFGLNNPLFAPNTFTPIYKARVLGAELRFNF
ncbi:TonB-dependent receptor [Sphingobium sp. SCG-1]|uniref:TonB-dependent receptor n=1 Tax=Sphingobium sp. SCG-1 TaxID=2072936 RepID=UPI000CD6C556|nr:TonB-dependent receptor [Sphingobium sp. SCG-1]AUW58162.1 TonB-dependent receptor [Sphingobium sp. SCG-1]